MKNVVQRIKKTTVFIEQTTPHNDHVHRNVIGTGFLIKIEGIQHFITARHVLLDLHTGERKKGLGLIGSTSTQGPRIDLDARFDKKIVTPLIRNKNVDIVICPIPMYIWNDNEIIHIEDHHITEEEFFETNDLIYCSFHPWVTEVTKNNRVDPIIRKGMISRVNTNGSIYMDGFAFPGNSGSPVFMKPVSSCTKEDSQWGKFVWIISSYMPYQDIAVSKQTGKPRVTFEENTGISIVFTMKYINGMLRSETMKKSLTAVKTYLSKE